MYNFMSLIMSMRNPNIHEVRDNLAEYLAAAERGEEVLICRRNQPVARLVAVTRVPTRKPRPIGKAADAGIPLPAAFFEPLPDHFMSALTGAAPSANDPLAPSSPTRGRR
ncbi:type II toxin-antitoxin system prevent-host-death family antitoxin [Methylibium sp.]|uniref:type II toxin-antitoxin system Phd/YefM family antitoxin n=1 Tax=Methylibium sp. TaxID=2067992 RepID=UPI00286B7F99|nr:type II toxin-antitoxin system prevent-host-death family antitoxin [Methylibium sp.]